MNFADGSIANIMKSVLTLLLCLTNFARFTVCEKDTSTSPDLKNNNSQVKDEDLQFVVYESFPYPEDDENVLPKQTREEVLALGYPDEGDVLYCTLCKKAYAEECPIHGPLFIINDTEIPMGTLNRAEKSCPPGIEIRKSSIPGAGWGAWTMHDIPARTRFGPYDGIISKTVDFQTTSAYVWQLLKNERLSISVDAIEQDNANWMRYVNSARHETEYNLSPYQYKGQMFYVTVKDVPAKTELLTWYGRPYADQLGFDTQFEPDNPFISGISASICPDGWISFNNYCYMFASGNDRRQQRVNWHRARELCRDQDALLVDISSIEENEFLMLRKPSPVWFGWIGLNNIANRTQHRWDGHKKEFSLHRHFSSHWSDPMAPGKHCVATIFTLWSSLDCSVEMNYVCKKFGESTYNWNPKSEIIQQSYNGKSRRGVLTGKGVLWLN